LRPCSLAAKSRAPRGAASATKQGKHFSALHFLS
jgi:hypothetical protein